MAAQNTDKADGRRDTVVDAAHVSYAPATPDNWTDGDPGTVADALDEARETGGTALDAHIAESTDPHGSTLTQSVGVISPKLQNAGDIHINAATSGVTRTVFVENTGVAGNADLDVDRNIIVGGTVDGRDIDADGTKLDGIEATADITDAANVNAAGAVMLTDVAAKGDIFVATDDNVLVNLGVGTNAQVLTADSGEASGVKWAAPTPTWTQITGKLFQVDKTFYAPDFIQDILPVAYYPVRAYPHGVTVVHVSIRLPQNVFYTLPFIRQTVGLSDQTIETVATASGGTELYKEVQDGNIDNPDVPADHWIMVNIPATDVDWLSVCVIVSVDDS